MNSVRNALALAIALAAMQLATPTPTLASTPISESNRPLDADGRVEIDNVAGKVEVRAWDKNEVAIEGKIGDGSKLVVSGDSRSLHYKVENPEHHGWFGLNNGPKEDSVLILKVPAAARVELDVVSADATIDGLKGSRELKIDAVSGDVSVNAEAERIEVEMVSGNLDLAGSSRDTRINTVSGDIRSRGLGGKMKVETVSGNAEFDCPVVDELRFSSVSGDARFEIAKFGGGDIKAETLSGRLRLGVPAPLTMRLRAESFSGNIDSEFGKVDHEEYGPGQSLDFRPADAHGDIRVESFSGNVVIKKH